MDPKMVEVFREAGNELFSMGLRFPRDAEIGDYDLLMAMTNRCGKVVAVLRAALERVPEAERR